MNPRLTMLGNNAKLAIPTPNSNDSQGFVFTGTSAATEPVVMVGTAGLYSGPPISFYSVSENGTAAHPMYGAMNLAPYDGGGVSIDHGIMLSHGNFTLDSGTDDNMAIGGNSVVANGSTFVVHGGRYHNDPLSINGTLTARNGASIWFDTKVQGAGTLNIEDNSIVSANVVSASLHVDIGAGGALYLYNYDQPPGGFQATVHEDAGSRIDLTSVDKPAIEVFHSATHTLDLLDAAGTQITSLKFAGNAAVYTAADGHGGMNITTDHSALSLPAFSRTDA